MAVQPAPVDRDDIRRSPVRQSWRDVVFLHWPIDPATVRPLLPAGTAPDVCEGSSWVGVIGLRMTDLRFGPIPYPEFRELNLRLYSIDENGRRAVVFRTLEATDPAFAALARTTLALPYSWADIACERGDGRIAYRTARRHPAPSGAGVHFRVALGNPIQPTALECALTDRWALHQSWYGRTLRLPLAHEPWPLRRATTLEWHDDGLFAACGLPPPEGPPHSTLYAESVTARFGPPTSVRPASWRAR
ncbi:YqjF family protein [Nocardia sp. NPDC050406]|uniref:YqjF family protein n=1 Tax=Nocardia sp. NPDC050406 TaxID=3364318 RepID=UPI0037A157F1